MSKPDNKTSLQDISTEGRDVWERLDGETNAAFDAFVIYRDMGATRSLRKVSEARGKLTATAEKKWSKRYAWGVRSRAYDDEQDRQRTMWITDERKKSVERHVRTAQALQSKALQALQTLNPADMSPSEVIRFAEVAIKMERDALGVYEPVNLNVTVARAVEGMMPEDVTARLRVLQKEIERRITDQEEDDNIEDAEVVE